MKLLNVDAAHDDERMHGLGVMGGLSVALPWSGGSRAMSPTSLSSCQVISINHLPWSWTSMLIMILCDYLMFCRRLECYNTGGCVLVESRPINKLCFRRIWRGWDFLSNQFLRRMWRRITKSWREGVGSEQPERDRSILRWSGKWMKMIREGQYLWLGKCKEMRRKYKISSSCLNFSSTIGRLQAWEWRLRQVSRTKLFTHDRSFSFCFSFFIPFYTYYCAAGIEIDEGPELHGPIDPVSISPYRWVLFCPLLLNLTYFSSHGEGADTSPKRGMTRETLSGSQVGLGVHSQLNVLVT